MEIIIYGFLGIFMLIILLREMSSRKLVLSAFLDGNVIVNGMRGRGKDLLFDWVINKRCIDYCSNVDYSKGRGYVEFKGEYLSLGGNTFDNFIDDSIISYEYPLEDKVDFYISDAGIYFPAQEHKQLEKKYPSYALFQGLSRHLGDCNFHCNVQNLNRLWDKIREQSDTYILMVRSRFWFGGLFHTMKGYVYDNYDACVKRVKPMKRRWGRLGKIEHDKFCAAYGNIRKFKITTFHRPTYDSRRFKEILRGKKNVEGRQEEVSETC